VQAHNPSHALALVVVDELARGGVTDAVLAPGSRSAALAMALHDDPRIRLHVELDERSAGFLAIGLARATGRVAPVVVTSGSAVANLHPAVIEADAARVPLLLLTADRPPELRHTGANQAIDQVALFGRALRWAVDLGVAEDRPASVGYWRSTVSRALAEATGASRPAGPVQVDLPFREPTVPRSDDGRASAEPFRQPLDGRDGQRPWLAVERAPRRLGAATLEDLAARIVATERGLLVIGQTHADTTPALALARAAGWPVIAEPGSGARTDELVVGTAHHLLAHEGFARAHRPDLVLRIGRTGLSRHLAALLGPDVPQVLLDPDGAWDDPDRAVSQLLIAEVAGTCEAVVELLAVPAGSAWLDRWRRADALAWETIDDILDGSDEPSEPRTARDLGAALPAGATLVAASSMPIRDLDQFLRPRPGLRIVANRGASGIDGFVSTALGVGLGSGGPVVALTGDLSLLHDANGFLLSPAVDRLDVTFVTVDNDGGGIFSFLPQAEFTGSFERIFGTPHGRDLQALARFHRLGYAAVTAASELPGAVRQAVDAGGLQLVHVRTDRTENLALHRAVTAAVGRALDQLADDPRP
jgi:2-succinyl-5-enolpyruvyl-6-hydroxy-3-cyclohexene-1-carboxylate synthase